MNCSKISKIPQFSLNKDKNSFFFMSRETQEGLDAYRHPRGARLSVDTGGSLDGLGAAEAFQYLADVARTLSWGSWGAGGPRRPSSWQELKVEGDLEP